MGYKILRVVFQRAESAPAFLIKEAIADLEKQVNDHMEDGWQPLGNATFENGDLCPVAIMQSMVK